MELVLFFGCLAIIGVGVFLLDCAFTRRRLRGLETQARRLGFSFERTAQPFAGTDIHGLSPLEDASTAVINVMKGAVGQCSALVFELARVNPACAGVAATTVAGFRCPCGHLPVFQMGKETLAHRFSDALQGKVDYDLGQGQQFFVHCADARGTQDFLTPAKMERLRLCAQHFRIESSPDWILVYRPGVRVRPEALPDFIQAAALVASTLLDRSPTAASAN